jgi:hypothetical protein
MNEQTTPTNTGATVQDKINFGISGVNLVDLTASTINGVKFMWPYSNPAFTGAMTLNLQALAMPNVAGYGTGSPIITLAIVKLIYIYWGGADGQICYFGPGASNAWTAWTDTPAARELIMPGTGIVKSNLLTQGSNPWTVSSGACEIKIDAGSNTGPLQIAILGA